MEKISFFEIENLFDTSLWIDGREKYWYRKAWECLEKNNLTTFNSREEECLIYVRIFTLNMIYREFCELVFEEECDYYFLDCDFSDYISELELGQLYAKYVVDNECEFSDDKSYVLCCLGESQRKNVFNAIYSELDYFGMFFGMYFTVRTPDYWFEEYEEDYYLFFNKCEIKKSYDEYWNAIMSDEEISTESYFMEDMTGFSWICEGTYSIHSFI